MLNYGLVSTAIAEDRQQLREGMRLLAKLAHKYRIPITWAITADSAQSLSNDLTEWHAEFGDDILLMLDIKSMWDTNLSSLTGENTNEQPNDSKYINMIQSSITFEVMAEHLVKMRQVLPQTIRAEWEKVEKAMDWVETSVVGAEFKTNVLVDALEKTGYKGLWGYRWNERDSIAESDRGCPFGFFYPSKEQHNFSASAASSMVGIPYQTESHIHNQGDNLRATLINDTITQQFESYVENAHWNKWLSFVKHINALDVPQLGQETLTMLEEYFEKVANNENTRMLTLSNMVDDYWSTCQQTEPTYVVVNSLDSLNNIETDDFNQNVSNEYNSTQKQDTKKEFFYYDAECQFTYVEGIMEPIEMKNYISPPVSENVGFNATEQAAAIHGVEYYLPKVENFNPQRKRSRLHITFSIESTKAMPYGIAIWGNHIGLQLSQHNAKEVTWVDKHLLFLRLSLEAGNNEFEIVLTI